jgi:hypothetical protein
MIANLTRLHFVNGEIDGYTDSTGRAEYNKGLSERRAGGGGLPAVTRHLGRPHATGKTIRWRTIRRPRVVRTTAEWFCTALTAASNAGPRRWCAPG